MTSVLSMLDALLAGFSSRSSWRETINTWRIRAESRRALSRLDARQLDDIGLTPMDVENEIRKPFWER